MMIFESVNRNLLSLKENENGRGGLRLHPTGALQVQYGCAMLAPAARRAQHMLKITKATSNALYEGNGTEAEMQRQRARICHTTHNNKSN